MMAGIRPPNETQQAVLRNGLLTCLFPGRPYARKLTFISVDQSSLSQVSVYVGAVAEPSLISRHPIGKQNENDFVNPRLIPAGFPLFVVWNTAVGTATATITTVEA